jgi:hypothetical protein
MTKKRHSASPTCHLPCHSLQNPLLPASPRQSPKNPKLFPGDPSLCALAHLGLSACTAKALLSQQGKAQRTLASL